MHQNDAYISISLFPFAISLQSQTQCEYLANISAVSGQCDTDLNSDCIRIQKQPKEHAPVELILQKCIYVLDHHSPSCTKLNDFCLKMLPIKHHTDFIEDCHV